ncbi:MAG: MBL fold metallo-hydrolase, partial [Candidatus Aminicenantes bacterium]|nr:MBL fold metallo-hydrolase [Candidatus Aminicenantes bacterium]
SHLKNPYIMGYDLYPLETLKKKKRFLPQACQQGWLLVFEHDPLVSWGYLTEKEQKLLLRPVKD